VGNTNRLLQLLTTKRRYPRAPQARSKLPLGEVWAEAEHAARNAEVLLVVGTSAVVYPAASLAPIAKSAGARVIEINPDETSLSAHVDLSLRGPAGEILPQLIGSDPSSALLE